MPCMSNKPVKGYQAFLCCMLFVLPFRNMAQTVIPGFTIPDTICVNNPLNISNTTTGASTYFWNFCMNDPNPVPTSVNLGNPGGYLSQPVYMDMAVDNGAYFGFVVNHFPGGITRLDFGNSPLNTPTPVFLGNIGNALNPNYGSEGIQVVKSNGKWYGIVAGGTPTSGIGATPRLVVISFGASLNNPAPTAVNWGNVGNMFQAIDIQVFIENGLWYGLTVNAENNTLTRLSFPNGLDNAPAGVNLGNIGGMNYPTGVFGVNDNGFWRLFVANQLGNSITRLDFGSSLANTPTGVNLGSVGNTIITPRDINIMKVCGGAVGYVVNATNDLVRLKFSSLSAVPTGTILGNIGNFNLPHSLSKFFRVGNDMYTFITNAFANSILRLKVAGCTNPGIPSSILKDPPPPTYSTPGTYDITLTVDDGLPTQNTLCKQVVVVAPPARAPLQTISLCKGASIKIGSSVRPATYTWNTGATTDSLVINAPGTYWVESARYGCSVRDSFVVTVPSGPAYDCDSIKVTGPATVCKAGDTVTYAIYKSPNCTQQYTLQADNTIATVVSQTATSLRVLFRQNGTTSIKATYANNCKVVADSLAITIRFSPTSVNLGPDITTCRDTAFVLHAGSGFSSYAWQNGTTDSVLQVSGAGLYTVTANNICNAQFIDSFRLTRRSPGEAFSVKPAIASACQGDSIQLAATGGTSYAWSPATNFNQPAAATPKASLQGAQSLSVRISDPACARDTSIVIPVNLLPAAQIAISKSNDITCSIDTALLTATGGVSYTWLPDQYVVRKTDHSISIQPPQTIVYYLQGKNAAGCTGRDSVLVQFSKEGDQKLSVPNAFSPDGNGTNETFHPVFTGPARQYSLAVYNRWGQLIFKTSSPQAGWDGTYHGIPQPQGTYVYYLTAAGGCNGTFVKKGTFLLLRYAHR